MQSALQLTGMLAYGPERVDGGGNPLTFVFLATGDEGVPQEVLVEGEAALEAERLRKGDLVELDCDLVRGLWRAVGLKVAERAETADHVAVSGAIW